MFEILSLTFWIVALGVVWKLWRRTVRDITRDCLFDRRDAWRAHWKQNGMDMRHPLYAHVRNRINACLRYTAQYRMLDAWHIASNIQEIAPVVREYLDRVDPEPSVTDDATRELMESIRRDSIEIMRGYMLLTSLSLFPVVVVVFVVLFVKSLAWDWSLRKAIEWVGSKSNVGHESAIESAVAIGDFNLGL